MGKDASSVTPQVAEQLRAYGALDNSIRLKAYTLIHDSPNLPFSDIAKQLHLASGLAAYHIGVLKASHLVDVKYGRRGMETSEYVLTGLGEKIFDSLFTKTQAVKSVKSYHVGASRSLEARSMHVRAYAKRAMTARKRKSVR